MRKKKTQRKVAEASPRIISEKKFKNALKRLFREQDEVFKRLAKS